MYSGSVKKETDVSFLPVVRTAYAHNNHTAGIEKGCVSERRRIGILTSVRSTRTPIHHYKMCVMISP